MTTRVVRGADGRQWTVRSQLDWRAPATSDEFENDVNPGNAAAIVLLVLVVALGVILIVWTPDDVVVPLWVVMLILLAILFFPARWALRRPWTVVAETGDNGENEPVERWVGVVRGMFTQRQQVNRTVRSIIVDSVPALEGPLQPVA
jgi:Na+/melibiose symporter-like transporter